MPPSPPAASLGDADIDLVQRAQDGDDAAFAALVRRHHAAAYAVARRIARDTETAEEATQDAFVRAWRALPRFRGEARFSTWLHRIVARCALDHARRVARRRVEVSVELDEIAAPAEAAPGPPADIEKWLGLLTEAQRAVVVLFYQGDRSVREIGAALDLPDGTVKTHLFRARATLRRAWSTERER